MTWLRPFTFSIKSLLFPPDHPLVLVKTLRCPRSTLSSSHSRIIQPTSPIPLGSTMPSPLLTSRRSLTSPLSCGPTLLSSAPAYAHVTCAMADSSTAASSFPASPLTPPFPTPSSLSTRSAATGTLLSLSSSKWATNEISSPGQQ